MIEPAMRYDIRGKQHIGAQTKYYFQDMGLRNALLLFRQLDEGHVMENVIYNELRHRGYLVDVGAVETRTNNGSRTHLEVDFVVNKGCPLLYSVRLPNPGFRQGTAGKTVIASNQRLF